MSKFQVLIRNFPNREHKEHKETNFLTLQLLVSLFLWKFFVNDIISSCIYVTLFYIIFLIFLVRYSASEGYGKHLRMEVICGHVWNLCIELFQAVSSFVESPTNNLPCILCKLALFSAIFNCIIRSVWVNNWRFGKNQNTCLEINVILSWKYILIDISWWHPRLIW